MTKNDVPMQSVFSSQPRRQLFEQTDVDLAPLISPRTRESVFDSPDGWYPISTCPIGKSVVVGNADVYAVVKLRAVHRLELKGWRFWIFPYFEFGQFYEFVFAGTFRRIDFRPTHWRYIVTTPPPVKAAASVPKHANDFVPSAS